MLWRDSAVKTIYANSNGLSIRRLHIINDIDLSLSRPLKVISDYSINNILYRRSRTGVRPNDDCTPVFSFKSIGATSVGTRSAVFSQYVFSVCAPPPIISRQRRRVRWSSGKRRLGEKRDGCSNALRWHGSPPSPISLSLLRSPPSPISLSVLHSPPSPSCAFSLPNPTSRFRPSSVQRFFPGPPPSSRPLSSSSWPPPSSRPPPSSPPPPASEDPSISGYSSRPPSSSEDPLISGYSSRPPSSSQDPSIPGYSSRPPPSSQDPSTSFYRHLTHPNSSTSHRLSFLVIPFVFPASSIRHLDHHPARCLPICPSPDSCIICFPIRSISTQAICMVTRYLSALSVASSPPTTTRFSASRTFSYVR
ncbi:hypothetical protein ACLOJK_011432 [Asimina triloba]